MAGGVLIGEICRRTDCTPRTIRHYETEGLITPISMTPGGRRLYGEDIVWAIKAIQILKRIGYPIKKIRSLLLLTKSENTRDKRLTQKLRKVLFSSISRIEWEIELLVDARDRIAKLVKKTRDCADCSAADCARCARLKDLRTLGLLTPRTRGNRPASL